MKRNRQEEGRRILGQVKREEFIGRTGELERLLAHAHGADSRGLLILLAPLAGVSELLKQTYDALFNKQGPGVPIYFALPAADTTPVSAAIEFLNAFLLQYIAFRRNEPALVSSALTLNEIVEVAPASDVEWIETLVENYNQHRFGSDDRDFVRLCLSAPHRVPASNPQPFLMFEAVNLATYGLVDVSFGRELIRALTSYQFPFALAGLRRQIVHTVECAGGNINRFNTLHLEQLKDDDARALVASAARRLGVPINEETTDLLVQQFQGSPFFLTAMLQSAREKHLSLDTYLSCERLYVDELLGGRLHRYFAAVLERIAPQPEIRRAIVRLLCEAVPAGSRTITFETWRKRLGVSSENVEDILQKLHAEELVNWDGDMVDTERGSIPWHDYLRSRFRLDALREPRALVVADVMAASLKRAPLTIATHFRRMGQLRLREVLESFNSQLVPAVLFNSEQFAQLYRGAPVQEIASGLATDTTALRLPQVFHAASGASFSVELREFSEEASAMAHGFEGATYSDQNEIVWMAARVESKLEADSQLTSRWLDLLENVGRKSGFIRTQLWLISNEGFSPEANALLKDRGAFGSSQQQFEILAERLLAEATTGGATPDEIELVLPMDSDYELIAANTVEQIARRLDFRPEAINQIKTAIVEASINAAEHSLSPDRKIYQRFRVESDKLVITVASRGIVPSNLNGYNRPGTSETENASEQRRGWGLKLIRTLMDEVEFERVDEGTRLRMTKFVRNGS
ncbi:MAG TPA: ATP-binding protein [Pyrinomonadaceae bacterium]|nr:ATP-binding protein [Pyrinomonadaceae bacterium]